MLILDFRMTYKLGEGTFSEVLKVKHKTTGNVYAMKRFRKRFKRYTRLMQYIRRDAKSPRDPGITAS
jgi:renal tumor antigen